MRMKFRKWIAVSGIVVLLEVAPGWMMVGTGAQKPGRSGQKSLGVGTRAELTRLPSESKRWALVIGVDKYTSPDLTPLIGATNDANRLAEALVKHAGFPEKQVIVMTSEGNEQLRPTRNNILERLTMLKGQVPEDGLFLFAFSGHGAEAEETKEAYLLPSDVAGAGQNQRLLDRTAIRVREVEEDIVSYKVKQVIVLLDSCRNDPGGKGNGERDAGVTREGVQF